MFYSVRITRATRKALEAEQGQRFQEVERKSPLWSKAWEPSGSSPWACEETSVCRSVSLSFLPAANTYWSC